MKEQGSDSPESINQASSRKISRRKFLEHLRNALFGPASLASGAEIFTGLAETVQNKQHLPALQETAMPGDILSAEELAERFHTTIYDLPESQFPDNYVELFLRRGVEETPLFQMLENGRLLAIDVLLIDSYKVDPERFTPQQEALLAQYPTVLNGLMRQIERAKESNRLEIEEHREEMRAEYHEKLQELQSQQHTLNSDQYSVRLQALEYSYGRYLTDNPTDEDLQELVIKGYAPTLGTTTDEQGRTRPRNFVFVSVRENDETVAFVSGNETLTISASRVPYREQESPGLSLSDNRSYPTLEDYDVADDADSLGYVVLGGPAWGYFLRHEFQHSRGVFDETGADEGFLQDIAEASRHKLETGSDEKYWAVFRTPQGVLVTSANTHPSNL